MSNTAPDHDQLVPDSVVAKEFGVSLMTLWRWSRDPDLDFAPPIKIRTKNFRSRHALELFKQRMMQKAIADRSKVQA